MNNVKVIRIISGEELIGDFEDTGDQIKLINVGVVSLVPTQTGVGISLYPFAPYAEESSFSFKKDHVVTTFLPSTDLLNNYNRMFGSGIQIASASALK